jgi:hypothetical protein
MMQSESRTTAGNPGSSFANRIESRWKGLVVAATLPKTSDSHGGKPILQRELGFLNKLPLTVKYDRK